MRIFNIYDIFKRNAYMAGNDTALVYQNQRLNFSELLLQTHKMAAGLSRQGITKGQRVAVLAYNRPQWFTIFGAVAALGAIVIPINLRLSMEEINYIIEDVDPAVVLVDDDYGAKINHTTIMNLDSDDLMVKGDFQTANSRMDDPFCIIHTAAMQGKPRGAVLSHGNIINGNMQTIAALGLNRKDAYLNSLPLFHITGMHLALSSMHIGGKNVIIKKFDTQEVITQIKTEKITIIGSFPPILTRLNKGLDNLSIPSLQHVMGIDQPETIADFESRTNAIFWALYGQTETSGMVSLAPARERPGSAGRQTLLANLKLVDDNGQVVPLGVQGEILVSGPLVFQGFWSHQGLDTDSIKDGWHYTGDLGSLDRDGYLWFCGRKPEKELIKPGGENVYPAEVEAILCTHHHITEAVVIGVPDAQFGEAILAVCEKNPTVNVSEDEVKEFVAQRIARYKKPKYVIFVDVLPRNATARVDRHQVKALYGKLSND